MRSVVGAAAFLIVIGMIIVTRFPSLANYLPGGVGELPKCDSGTTIDLAKQAIEEAPITAQMKLKVYEIRDAEEMAYDNNSKRRSCKAKAFLNLGEREIKYHLEWANEGERKMWLQIDYLPLC